MSRRSTIEAFLNKSEPGCKKTQKKTTKLFTAPESLGLDKDEPKKLLEAVGEDEAGIGISDAAAAAGTPTSRSRPSKNLSFLGEMKKKTTVVPK